MMCRHRVSLHAELRAGSVSPVWFGLRPGSAAELHDRVVEVRELLGCLLDHGCGRLLPVGGESPRDGGECLMGLRGPVGLVVGGSLLGAEAVGEQPQEVTEASGHDAGFALGAEEDDRLLVERLVGAHQPEGRISSGAVLAEHAEGVAAQLWIAGPGLEPVSGVLSGEEGRERFEVDAVAFVVIERNRKGGGERGRKLSVISKWHADRLMTTADTGSRAPEATVIGPALSKALRQRARPCSRPSPRASRTAADQTGDGVATLPGQLPVAAGHKAGR